MNECLQSDGFNAWWMKLEPFLLQLVIRWPITDRLFFCSSLSCVCVHVCWLRGVPCNKLLRVCGAEEAMLCFNIRVSSNSCSVMLKHALKVRGVICTLFFLISRRVRGGDTDFLFIGKVFDATCFARPVSQRATRRKVQCLFVVALR